MDQAHTTQRIHDNAARIRAVRLQFGLSQTRVARELGWLRSRLSSYENGHLPFSAEMEARIVEAIRRAAAESV